MKGRLSKAPDNEYQFNFRLDDSSRKCPLCAKTFQRNAPLKAHLMKKHSISENCLYKFVNSISQETDDGENETFTDIEYGDDISDEENDDDEEEVEQRNFLYDSISGYMRATTEDSSSDIEQGVEALDQAIDLEYDWNRFLDSCHPFGNLQTMVMHCLVDGDNDMISERILKKILFAINIIVKLKETSINNETSFRMPKLDALVKFQTRLGNKIPVFDTKKLLYLLPLIPLSMLTLICHPNISIFCLQTH